MSEVRHRLAAVLFADIQGYSSLMQEDESEALKMLSTFKDVLERTVPTYQGKIIQFYGDGCMVTFESSSDAIRCARQLQITFGLSGNLPARIGIHAGEVVFRDGNAFGDAVNIASRVESMCIPGAVLITESVYEQVKNKDEFVLVELGRFRFKHIEKEMAVFALSNDGLTVPDPKVIAGKYHGKLTARENVDRISFSSRIPKILAVLAIVSVIAYFTIFSNSTRATNTYDVSFVDKDGTRKSLTQVKQENQTRLVIFPFDHILDNLEGDWLKIGIPEALRLKLSLNKYIDAVANYYRSGIQLQGDINFTTPLKIDATSGKKGNYYIDGSYRLLEEGYEIQPAIHESETGSVLNQRSFSGNDFSALIDSMSMFIKSEIGFNETKISLEIDLEFDEMITHDIEAYRAFVRFHYLIEPETGFDLDTTFAWGDYNLAFVGLVYSMPPEDIRYYSSRALRHYERLPEEMQVPILALDYWVHGDLEKAEEYYLLQLEIDPASETAREGLIDFYKRTSQFEKALALIEEYGPEDDIEEDEILGFMGLALLNGDLKKAKDHVVWALQDSPTDASELTALAQVHLHEKDYQEARRLLQRVILLNPTMEKFLNYQLRAIDYLETHPDYGQVIPRYEGEYRSNRGTQVVELSIHGGHLFNRARNQPGWFMYPDSDSSIACGMNNWAVRSIFLQDESGKVYARESVDYFHASPSFGVFWKLDQSIKDAETLLMNGEYAEALAAYDEAIEKNPRHYYLQEQRSHIQYMLSHTMEEVITMYQRYIGEYQVRDITVRHYVENNRFVAQVAGERRKQVLYPISDDQFILMSSCNIKLKFEDNENGRVIRKGMWYLHEEGKWSSPDDNWTMFRVE